MAGMTKEDFIIMQGNDKVEEEKMPKSFLKEMQELAAKQLKFLGKRWPRGLNQLGGNEWEEIEFNVGSGASETVVGELMLKSVETKEGEQKRNGIEYEVANGVEIPNLGEKKFIGHMANGSMRGITAQVTEVNKALMSVSRMLEMGNRVVFDKGEGN